VTLLPDAQNGHLVDGQAAGSKPLGCVEERNLAVIYPVANNKIAASLRIINETGLNIALGRGCGFVPLKVPHGNYGGGDSESWGRGLDGNAQSPRPREKMAVPAFQRNPGVGEPLA